MNTTLSTCPPLVESLDDALHDIFGFEEFREGQREVVEGVVAGRDTLVVMPTGSGKSLCFQLPACVIDGITLVISPLIALMKDQMDALKEFGIPATLINSSISFEEQRSRLREIVQGRYKVVYVAPERFRNQFFLDAISQIRVGLLAIDEAHCISQWGHDFRPDYLALGQVRELLGRPTTVALTATATPDVQQDILRQLSLENAEVVISGFARPNLFFEVFPTRQHKDKHQRIQELVNHWAGESVVIYCATRKQVEEVIFELKRAGIEAGMYHGGLSDADREYIQDAFMSSERPVLVATNAFGMGVDKPDVRAIIHYNFPGSIEAYYQEAGRAGRDGQPAHCLLLYNYADRRIHDFFVENSNPTPDVIRRLWAMLSKYGVGTHALSNDQIAQHLNRSGRGAERVHPMAVDSALRQLRAAGHIDYGYRDGQPWVAILDQARARDLRIDWANMQKRRDNEERHLLDVIAYASGHTCRQQFLLRYFSSRKSSQQKCGHCDVCSGRPEYAQNQAAARRESPIYSPDSLDLLVKKLLSGVARVRGKWGTHAVAGMLRGSASKKLREGGLDRLSTFGLLGYLRQQDLVELLDYCQQGGLVTQNVHGAIALTDLGVEVMRGAASLPDFVQDSFARRVRFGEAGAVPPVRRRSVAAREDLGGAADTYERTLELLQQGKSFEEIATERGLTTASILRHLMVLADDGHALDLSGYVKEEWLPRIREVAGDWEVGKPLAPLKEQLPIHLSYDELKLHLAFILGERRS